ncbi:MAG: 4Fe-4S dicluster domain-containing protein [Anaerolineae bacterium]|nr:4Fe-4S dicluster domain-containing protein [Anaerolineae bacterium]
MSENESQPVAPAPPEATPAPPAPAAAPVTTINRRDMLTLLLGSGMSLVLAAMLAEPLEYLVRPLVGTAADGHGAETGRKYHWAMVIDLSKCVGCDYCVYACQATNDTADDHRWNIRVDDETATGTVFHITRPCLHCRNAPCVDVCPVKATYHRDDGLVVMDYAKCIGCRYCQTACPYGARVFNWADRTDTNPRSPEWGEPEVPRRPRGVVEKCTFCIHRIDAGLARGKMPGVDAEATPACVNICPVQARYFGNLLDATSTVARIIATTPTLRLREDLGTDPSVYYIPPEGLI